MDAATRTPTRPDWPTRTFAPLYHRLLDRIDRGLAEGAIEAYLPDGTRRLLGGHAAGPLAVVRVVRWRALRRLATAGSIGWYDGWEAGDWSSPDPVPLFDLFMRNRVALGNVARAKSVARIAARGWHALRRNDRAGARRNIAAHYDLGNDFYREWLDPTLTYSSASFAVPDEPLERAQRRKLDAILARTAARPGEGVLEIGCGWGSFAAAASSAGVAVHALTLSTEQRDHVAARALPGVTVALTDYRDVQGTFDGVASIEMVEAVGPEFWSAYLATIARVLKPGGRAALQFITIADDIWDAYAGSVDFIQRYVFPGGSLISERRFRALAERHGLSWQDRRAFGLDYAETLARWRDAFDAAVADGRLPARFDARFQGLWRYYLMYCEGGFRGGGIDVVQVTLVRE
ncbi:MULTISPECIES: SAM-dependent methyltransferase [Sphingomonas]|jgi:cyclopropane-fatty-acyl-phospholipid synthase|uniref:SAM-dependent methyltransferase n=1 Tax=Sphingomonas ginsenosidimutans TaxID=862134 RepID=A0A2A4HY73_9SPHN|nr:MULTISPECIES: cyclopropane-fatty-acyl-phospholipid synthase family protein [Sphingomonas]MBY0303186.1 cyclopropane-fatty-acyl-phospholipid synthase family protein [Sphingomonas ginsenosidimutans]MEE2916879.1 cyclopropane-fatty-acyl-phospholipid synthase family protein [Pseudomonadota bacterium]PCG08859.1 SAM-dependent methyltransferase [Sphingomonas ginsenosidimutans]